jgi:glycosyltransferase involved in cell wall biosynthesis
MHGADRRQGLISVVIPTFNRSARVLGAIASVACQTYPDIEIVVVDDGSTDGTGARLRELVSARPLRVIEVGINEGAPAARNRGIAASAGRWVAFLDSDDVWHPRKLERQIAALSSAGADFGACYTGLAAYDDEGRLRGVSRATEVGDIRAALMTHNLVGSTSSVLIRRDLLTEVGGFAPALRSCQDWDLWVRLSRLTKFACVPEILTVMSAAPSARITSDAKSRLSGHLYMYRTHLRPHFKAGTADPALFRTVLGEIFMQLERPHHAARIFRMNWQAKRRSLKRLALYAMAYAGVGKARFFRTEDLLSRLELHLRPPPVQPPLDPLSFPR